MIPAQVIAKKRDGHALSAEEIQTFISLYTSGEIADYQMSALAMAICLRDMSIPETTALTRAMLESGQRLAWSSARPKVDKHSTGGLGDKVSLILAPLLACCDLCVPMISGRGLGITGGTLDKLDSIPGFRTQLELGEFRHLTETIGCAMSGATADLAPADRKLYALRDVTGTVESIPLITASILSKKLAESLDALVLDVKFGSGAFMATNSQAQQLAESLVCVASQFGVRTTALLTDMNQPLGRMVGNSVEVQESVDVLQGGGPQDVRHLTCALGAELLLSAGQSRARDEALARLQRLLDDGTAFERFEHMVVAQGGRLPAAPVAPATEICATRGGWVTAIDGRTLGAAIIEMRGGRKVLTDTVDPSVGLEMRVRVGDHVDPGQPLLRVMAKSQDAERVRANLIDAIRIAVPDSPPIPLPLITHRVTSEATHEYP